MGDIPEKNASPSVSPQQGQQELPLDTRLLSDAVIELNISRKNVGIYPPGHVQITRSIDQAYAILQKLFEIRSEMTLGIAKDTLLVGQDYLDRKNPVYRDFALSLSQRGIAAVTFISGMDRDELVRFHRVITTKPEDIREAGGIGKVISDAGVPHVKVQAIDYSSFHLTEEKEIVHSAPRPGEDPGTGKWQDFVSHLVAGGLASSGQGVALKDATEIDPGELARLLNERAVDAHTAVESYDQIITDHVRGMAERKQPSQEQAATLANMNDLLRDLHPELRKQFLSVAFRHIASSAGSSTSEDLLGGFPDDMVIEMMRHASEEGRQISPTLAGLVQKLSAVDSKGPAGPGQEYSEPGQEKPAPVISPEHMEKLFDRESYEQYVTSDYDATLKNLTQDSGSLPVARIEGFPLEEFAETLEDEPLDFQIGRALLAFMEEDIEEDDYGEFSRKLIVVVPDLLKTGNFELLLDAVETLRRHGREKASQEVRALAGEALKIFSEPEFLSDVVNSFDGWARSKGRAGAGFLLALGPGTVPALMDLFSLDEAPGGRRILFDLLSNFGQPAVDEAVKRLRDPRAYYVRNLVMLIRWTGSQATLPYVKPLLKHQDQKVRLEVIAALLRFKDRDGVPLLREALRSKDPDVSSQAVFLSGQFRVADVTGDVLSMIKKVILFEADYTVNEEIIRALGEIGDARAIPDLKKFAKASWTFYPARLARMKVALFESLGRYPRESIADLLKIGNRSGDERIRRICGKLAERKAR